MINRERLAELRKAIMDHSIKTMCGSDHPCRYDPMELFDTLSALLTVKEAAESQDYKCPALQMALAAVKEGA